MGKTKYTQYTRRYVSRIVLEAVTPISVGSGNKDLLTDSLVVTDINGLPIIPGTSLAGVIRSACGIGKNAHTPFGFQEKKKDGGEGSRVIFSDAVMVGKDGLPVDGLRVINFADPFYAHFKTLPIRQHVRINDKGCAEDNGKFDGQVVYKGTRFCFEMELLSKGGEEDRKFYEQLLDTLRSDTFRLGSGTRNGYGLVKVVSILSLDYNLCNNDDKADLESYVSRSASLDKPLDGAKEVDIKTVHDDKWKRYVLKLKPADFFLFGSGLGDNEADITPVSEPCIEWEHGKPSFINDCVLIPASSVKGALAHRTAYHWNKLGGRFADKGDADKKPLLGDDNDAVVAIFGKAGNKKGDGIERGNIMLSDVLLSKAENKISNHVSLDRFTGGSMDGALFTEKVTNRRNQEITLTIDVLRTKLEDTAIKTAFEKALDDIAKGLLPLGGGVNRGNGTFIGELIKED